MRWIARGCLFELGWSVGRLLWHGISAILLGFLLLGMFVGLALCGRP
jgi:hypothetical protein